MRIGSILKKHRAINDVPAKTLAVEIGISVSTLYRIEEGAMVDGAMLMKLFNWLCAETGGKDADH